MDHIHILHIVHVFNILLLLHIQGEVLYLPNCEFCVLIYLPIVLKNIPVQSVFSGTHSILDLVIQLET